jgi:hypothetical protein
VPASLTPHRTRQLLRAALTLFLVAAIVLLAVVAVDIAVTPQSAATKKQLNVARSVFGIVSALAAVGSLALAYRQTLKARDVRSILLAPHLLPDTALVDRSAEMEELATSVGRSRSVVNCFGDRGFGKSFLLAHTADTVNGHRRPPQGHRKLGRVSAALYFELPDAAGFAEIQRQVCQAALGRADGTWPDFVAFVSETFKRRTVLLILDNVNNPGVWRDLGRAVHSYLASRTKDRVVLGSIPRVSLDNLDVNPFAMTGFDLDATRSLR